MPPTEHGLHLGGVWGMLNQIIHLRINQITIKNHCEYLTYYKRADLLEVLFVLVVLWFLKPVKELSTGVLELEYDDSPCGALGHSLQLSVTREDDKVLPE